MSESNKDGEDKAPASGTELPDSDLEPVAGGVWWPDGGCIPTFPFPKGPFPRDPIPVPIDPYPYPPPEPA